MMKLEDIRLIFTKPEVVEAAKTWKPKKHVTKQMRIAYRTMYKKCGSYAEVARQTGHTPSYIRTTIKGLE